MERVLFLDIVSLHEESIKMADTKRQRSGRLVRWKQSRTAQERKRRPAPRLTHTQTHKAKWKIKHTHTHTQNDQILPVEVSK